MLTPVCVDSCSSCPSSRSVCTPCSIETADNLHPGPRNPSSTPPNVGGASGRPGIRSRLRRAATPLLSTIMQTNTRLDRSRSRINRQRPNLRGTRASSAGARRETTRMSLRRTHPQTTKPGTRPPPTTPIATGTTLPVTMALAMAMAMSMDIAAHSPAIPRLTSRHTLEAGPGTPGTRPTIMGGAASTTLSLRTRTGTENRLTRRISKFLSFHVCFFPSLVF